MEHSEIDLGIFIGYGEGISNDERPDLVNSEENWGV